jgi:hypothetical protein
MENETLVGPWLWGEQIFVSHLASTPRGSNFDH